MTNTRLLEDEEGDVHRRLEFAVRTSIGCARRRVHDPGKWGQWWAPGPVRGSGRRPLTLVNRRVDRIVGLPTVPSLLDIGTPPELVVVCVPPAQVESALRDAVEVGARGAIVITAGIDAIVGDGGEAAMVGHAVAGGMRVIGPQLLRHV